VSAITVAEKQFKNVKSMKCKGPRRKVKTRTAFQQRIRRMVNIYILGMSDKLIFNRKFVSIDGDLVLSARAPKGRGRSLGSSSAFPVFKGFLILAFRRRPLAFSESGMEVISCWICVMIFMVSSGLQASSGNLPTSGYSPLF
jgi:hypothetical protein